MDRYGGKGGADQAFWLAANNRALKAADLEALLEQSAEFVQASRL